MRKSVKVLAATATLAAGVAAAPVLHAHDSDKSQPGNGSIMGPGMMGQGGMMNMIGQMSQMMQGAMGKGSDRPNEQWHKEAPSAPDKNG